MRAGRKHIGIDMALADRDVTAFVEYVRKNGEVTIAQIGTFKVVKIKGRTLYHNTGKRTITTKEYNKLKFEPSTFIKSLINGNI